MRMQFHGRDVLGLGYWCLLALVPLGVQEAVRAAPPERVQGRALDTKLRKELRDAGITAFDPGPVPDPALVELGQALFFDLELSGNRDTSCATCHHPFLGTGDGLSLPVGTGPQNPGAIGHDRIKGSDREFIPRNAPEVFDRGSPAWTSQFWDSRISLLPMAVSTIQLAVICCWVWTRCWRSKRCFP
jgi:cytochrome c peroxidase